MAARGRRSADAPLHPSLRFRESTARENQANKPSRRELPRAEVADRRPKGNGERLLS